MRLMITSLLAVVLLATAAVPAMAAISQAEFNAVMGGSDRNAKRDAVNAAAALHGSDPVASLQMLAAAANDRQVQQFAINHLRSLTGLAPDPDDNNPGYPGYPQNENWSGWVGQYAAAEAARQRQAETEARLEAALNRLEEVQEQVDEVAEDQDGEETGDGMGEVATTTPAPNTGRRPRSGGHDEYGQLDRVVFRSGASLVCYVVQYRRDLDGNPTSVTIMHRDGAGEETLDWELIARIDEDIR